MWWSKEFSLFFKWQSKSGFGRKKSFMIYCGRWNLTIPWSISIKCTLKTNDITWSDYPRHGWKLSYQKAIFRFVWISRKNLGQKVRKPNSQPLWLNCFVIFSKSCFFSFICVSFQLFCFTNLKYIELSFLWSLSGTQ